MHLTKIKFALCLLMLLLTAVTFGQKKGRTQKDSKPRSPNWVWLQIAEDESGKSYFIDKSAIFRVMETVTYSTKTEKNGVDVVFVAVSNCLTGTLTGIPAFIIDKDGEVTKLSQTRESIESTNGEPLEQGTPYHKLMLYACKNAKQMK